MARKLKITDANFFRIIGKKGGDARKAAGVDYSALAASSHVNRTEYHGGRPKGSKNKKKAKMTASKKK